MAELLMTPEGKVYMEMGGGQSLEDKSWIFNPHSDKTHSKDKSESKNTQAAQADTSCPGQDSGNSLFSPGTAM